MSSKIQHVQDNAVVERRLRPIYDWLDIGNNKKALQECEKVLKKTPNLHCAKALKALTLHRMGKEQMAVEILDNLTLEKPTDDATLQAMTLCYRELQQLDKICKLYETAVKLDPNNEELHTHLFMSYARIFDFKSQQKTAMQLYKFKPKTPYYCWAVMSIILQATRSSTTTTTTTTTISNNNDNNTNNNNNNDNSDNDNHQQSKDRKKRLLLLNLAERMMDKLIIDNKLDAEQEIQLYIMILELQNKFIDIIKLLDGPLGDKLICTNQPSYRIKYLKKLKLWHDVNLLCKIILVDNIDRWDIWKDYVNSVFEILDQKTQNEINNHETTPTTTIVENENDSVDDTPEKCHEFICRIVENTTDNGYRLRGPYLARFELYKKLLERNLNPIELLGDLIELFIEYYRKFGYKSCCVSDLRLYLNLLKQQEKQQIDLSTKLLNEIGINSMNVPKNEQQMRQHLTAIQLTRLCGIHKNLTKEHLLALITSYSLHYQHGYQTYGRNLLITDIGPADQYAILATHLLYDLSRIENTTEPIIAGLILLETLLKNSPSNFHAKLLSIRLYHTVGGTFGAQNMYNSLDLRHLQLDSLGFVHCARLPTTGLFSLYTNLCDATLKFFSSNYKDSSDHITFSYKYGSFIKLDEFMDFRERLNNSIHYTTCAIDRIVLTLIDCTNLDALYNLDISPKDDKIDWEHLRDNHDLSVYMSWDPERVDCPPEEQPEIQQLFQQDVDYLKLRTNILWSLSNSVIIIKTHDSKLRMKHIENLNEILNEWENLIKTVHKKNYTPLRQDLVTLPLPSRLHAALDVHQFDILINCFKIFSNVANANYVIDDLLKEIEQSFGDLIKNFKDRSLTKDICIDLIQRRILMEHIVNSVEIFSISSLICLLCNDLLKPLQQSKRTRKQGGSNNGSGGANLSNHQQNHRRDWLLSFVNSLKTSMNQLCEIVENLSNFTASYDLTKMFEILNLNDDIDNNHGDKIDDNNKSSEVNENITKSYQYACREVQRVLQSKVKMLNCV